MPRIKRGGWEKEDLKHTTEVVAIFALNVLVAPREIGEHEDPPDHQSDGPLSFPHSLKASKEAGAFASLRVGPYLRAALAQSRVLQRSRTIRLGEE